MWMRRVPIGDPCALWFGKFQDLSLALDSVCQDVTFMANRHERRAARKKGVIFVDYGHLDQRDPNYGSPVQCYVCGVLHNASGVARIEGSSIVHVALCELCLASDPGGNGVLRKFLNAPGLEIEEGGEATTEQVFAMADKSDATEH